MAVAVVSAGGYSSNSTPRLGNSMCRGCGRGRKSIAFEIVSIWCLSSSSQHWSLSASKTTYRGATRVSGDQKGPPQKLESRSLAHVTLPWTSRTWLAPGQQCGGPWAPRRSLRGVASPALPTVCRPAPSSAVPSAVAASV